MTNYDLKRMWEDERNWGHGAFGAYFCREDPRLVVPKRGLPGGTFNMAHRWAIPLLTGLFLLPIFVLLIVLLVSARIF